MDTNDNLNDLQDLRTITKKEVKEMKREYLSKRDASRLFRGQGTLLEDVEHFFLINRIECDLKSKKNK